MATWNFYSYRTRDSHKEVHPSNTSIGTLVRWVIEIRDISAMDLRCCLMTLIAFGFVEGRDLLS